MFKGLGDFLQKKQSLANQETPFLEWGHDAPEVGYVYNDGCSRVEVGVKCLRTVRSFLAGSKMVTLHTTGMTDLSGKRLLVEVEFFNADGSSIINGEALIKLGLSHPTTRVASAPRSYQYVAVQVQSRLSGLYVMCNGAVQHQLLSWNLRQSLTASNEVTVTIGSRTIKVTTGGQSRFEGNVMVLPSRIPRAGMGCLVAGSPGSFITCIAKPLQLYQIFCSFKVNTSKLPRVTSCTLWHLGN